MSVERSSLSENRARSGGIRDRMLTVTLIAAAVAAVVMLSASIANPQLEPFTDFYILGPDGEAADYPEKLAAGEEAEVLVGIVNQEQEPVSYRLAIMIEGSLVREAGPLTLEHKERWQEVVAFTPDRPGDRQKVEFWLYRLDRDEAYHHLHLWIDVTE
jgi:uncharacterized membrane protein